MAFLYEKMDTLREAGVGKEIPSYIQQNINPNFELRPYQKEAFENFVTYFEGDLRQNPSQTLFHMATGSGKTLIMAGLMLYLYKQGYRNFLFFVNLSNIVEKTKVNFLDASSTKYLFNDEIVIDGERVVIQEVSNFQTSDPGKINICFSTTQGLHVDMWMTKENGLSYDDFDSQEVVLISDEAHHLNVDTKKKMSAEESDSYHSWEQTVKNISSRNSGNVLLEFTATCDLENQAIKAAYENKIIFNYPLPNFYQDRYSKDILTLRSDLPLMDRALQALVLSQYRLKVFQDHRLSIKPVDLFKAAKIADSKDFMASFIDTVSRLSGNKLRELSASTDNPVMKKAFTYFTDNGISADTLAAELRDDFAEPHCVSVNDDKDAQNKQILLNSLEDTDNPYRAIFEVKKLDEGWDVLNLFDIVRLYETRQSSGRKISPATIAEALREIGLDTDKIVQREYVLKDDFKTDPLYQDGLIFTNDREVKSRKEVFGLKPTVRDTLYSYTYSSGRSGLDAVMLDGQNGNDYTVNQLKTLHMTIGEIASINYAIVNKAMMKYPIFRFNTLKSYFPNIHSTRDFVTKDEYLGKVRIDIHCPEEKPSVNMLYQAVFDTLKKIGDSISGIEETYLGTKKFRAHRVREVFRNKTVNYTDPHDGGVGISQNDSSVPEKWKIDLSQEDWFVYTDNFGTSEEKAFVAYFHNYVEELRKVYSKVYLVRNEREFHLYSFEDGERFEPDYVIFLQRPETDGFEQLQIFVEPKGTMLLEKDKWKEDFLLQMKTEAIPVKTYVDNNQYRIWGLHFFNQDTRMKEFDEEVQSLISADGSSGTSSRVVK